MLRIYRKDHNIEINYCLNCGKYIAENDFSPPSLERMFCGSNKKGVYSPKYKTKVGESSYILTCALEFYKKNPLLLLEAMTS